ncbi:MAG: hypothetical protein IPO14_04560 [Saprospiraceae bacterium]|nr:hypothetical protein [Saprospiraceae bacterium]
MPSLCYNDITASDLTVTCFDPKLYYQSKIWEINTNGVMDHRITYNHSQPNGFNLIYHDSNILDGCTATDKFT